MKKILTILILTIYISNTTAQINSLNDNEYILFKGVSNPINKLIKNLDCKTLFLQTNNGEIIRDSCNFYIIPNKHSRAYIYVKQIKDGDTTLLSQDNYIVKLLPAPKPKIGGRSGGSIARNWIHAQTGIQLIPDNLNKNYQFEISRFSVAFYRGPEPVFEQFIEGARFTKDVNDAIRKLQKGDKMIVTHIFSIWPDGDEYELGNTIEFIIR